MTDQGHSQDQYEHYRRLFEDCPVSLWEEDLSAVMAWLEELRASGVEDLRQYLDADPARVIAAMSLLRVVDVNQATVALFEAADKHEVLQGFARTLTDCSYQAVTDQLVALWRGDRSISIECEGVTFKGRPVQLLLQYNIPMDGQRGDFSRVVVAVSDMTARKTAEARVTEDQARIDSIFRAAPTGIGVVRDRVVMEVNDRLCEMVGYSRDELIGQSARIFYPTDADFEYVGREKYEQIHLKGTGTVETHWRCRDGSIIDVLLSSTPLDPADLSVGVTFTVLDITDRKRVLAALQESESRYKAFFEAAPDAILLAEPETGIIVDANAAASRLLGIDVESIVGMHQTQIHPAHEYDSISRAFAEHVALGGTIEPLETTIKRSDGTEVPVEVLSQMVHVRGRRLLQGTFRDVSARADAERALRESEEKYRTLTDQSLTGVFINLEGRYVFVNDRFAEMTGYSRQELIGQPYQMVVHPDSQETVAGYLGQRLAGEGAPQQYTLKGIRKDGEIVWCEITAGVIEYMGKTAVMGNIMDITQRKRIEEHLQFTQFALDHAGDPVFWTTQDSRIIYVNDAACNSLGYTREQLLKLRVSDIDVDYITDDKWHDHWADLQRRKSYTIESHHRASNGRIFPVEISVNYVTFQGMEYHCAFARDISERKTAEAELKYRITLENTITRISTDFIKLEPQRLNEAINRTLSTIGRFTDTDRCYAFLFSDDGVQMSNTHEWCRDGITAQMDRLQNVPIDTFYCTREHLSKSRIWQVPRVADLGPEAEVDKREFEAEGIQSIICVPMVCGDQMIGFLGFDSVRSERTWAADDIRMLKIVGEIIANAIVRNRAQEEIRKFKTISDFANYGTAIADFDGEFVYVNREFARMHGMEISAMAGHSISVAHSPEQMAAVNRLIETVKTKGGVIAEEVWHRRANGVDFPTLMNASLVRDHQGNPLFLSATAIDITERKLAEDRLRESEERFRTIVTNAEAVIFMIDRQGVFVLSEGRGLAALGLAPGEVVGKSALEMYKDYPDVIEGIKSALNGNFQTGSAEVQGVIFEIFYSPNYDAAGNIAGMIGMAIDRTQRIRAMNALKDSELRYRLLVESAEQPIFTVKRDGSFEFANAAAARQLGIGGRDFVGMSITDVFDRAEAEQQMSEVRKAFQSGQLTVSEHQVTVQGKARWFYSRIQPMAEPDGQIKRALVILTDITDSKLTETQIREHRDELAHVWRVNTIGEMASGLAHELNQPLCAILNYADASLRLMQSGQPLDNERIVHAVERISDQADRAGEIIRRIRALAGKREPHRAAIDVNEVIQEVVAMVKTEASEEGIEIKLNLIDDLPRTQADQIEVEEVVLNLVRNAMDALVDMKKPDRHIVVNTSTTGDRDVLVAVSDTGRGLAPGMVDQIFDPFYTTKAKGLGIGLSLSRTIIEAHGGKLWAEPHDGHGARFCFTLPVEVIR